MQQLDLNKQEYANIFLTDDIVENQIKEQSVDLSQEWKMILPQESARIGNNFLSTINTEKLTHITNINKIVEIQCGSFNNIKCLENTKVWLTCCKKIYQNENKNIFNNAKEIVLNDNGTSLCCYAFSENKNLINVVNLSKIKDIPDYCFSNTSLKGKVWLNSAENIGKFSFENCQMEYVCIKNKDCIIDKKSFDGCKLLKNKPKSKSRSFFGWVRSFFK